MKIEALNTLVEQAVGKQNAALIAEALARYEVQSECSLTERVVVEAARKAHAYVTTESQLWAPTNTPLSIRYQLISEHLLAS